MSGVILASEVVYALCLQVTAGSRSDKVAAERAAGRRVPTFYPVRFRASDHDSQPLASQDACVIESDP